MNDSKNKHLQKNGGNRDIWKIINSLYLGIVFIISYYFIQMQISGIIVSDTLQHLAFLDQYLNGEIYIPHPLWHLGSYYTSKIIGANVGTGASVFTALLISFYAFIIYKIAKSIDDKSNNETKWFLVTMIALTIGPFFVKSLNPYIYMGPGSPSIWHNVTLLAVKPFALLSIYFTIRYLSNEKNKFLLAAILTVVVSIFAKPNFIIVFLPSLFLYIVLKKYFDKKRIIFAVVIALLSIAALAYQFANQYNGGEASSGGSIIFDFLGVWSKYTPSVTISILMALGLPALISFFNYRSVKNNEYIKFSWLLVLFSMILFACFAESGKRYAEGNFSWSWHISLSLIYIFTLIEYFKNYFQMKPFVRYSLLIIILYQVYVGWYFLIGMLEGINYHMPVENFPFF